MAREVLLLDAALPDLAAFIGSVRPGVQIRLVASSDDGRRALRSAWADAEQALHIVAHGMPGQLFLGQDRVTKADIGSLGKSGADVFLYGCHVGAGEEGREFIEAVASRTKGALRAATGRVGHSSSGASWRLDVELGYTITEAAIQEGSNAWRHALVYRQGTSASETLLGSSGSDQL